MCAHTQTNKKLVPLNYYTLRLLAYTLYHPAVLSINNYWDSLRNQDTWLTGHSTSVFRMIVVCGIGLLYWIKSYEQSEMPVVCWGSFR